MKELTLLFIVGLTMVSAASLKSLDTEPGMQAEDKKAVLKMMLKSLIQNALEDDAKDREVEMQAEEKEMQANDDTEMEREMEAEREEKEMDEMQAQEIAARDMELENAVDPCPTYWVHFQGSCYRYFGDRVTWEVARESCKDHYSISGQAELASIHSQQENSFAYDLFLSAAGGSSLAGHTYYGAWIGFFQPTASSTGPFQWSDGTSASDFDSWLPRQPDNAGNNEGCTHFWRRNAGDDTLQSWNDAPCTLDFPYICKVAPNN
uniref:Secreted lectin homolog n=1 Tax=Heliocidaris erythrogramma TaxID=7634 RepID=O76289_HELER|nr:secreted lectin homolog [Heliocidaris erythrogramma]